MRGLQPNHLVDIFSKIPEIFPENGYKKFLGMAYEKFLGQGNKKFFGMGYKKFRGNNCKQISSPGQTPATKIFIPGSSKWRIFPRKFSTFLPDFSKKDS